MQNDALKQLDEAIASIDKEIGKIKNLSQAGLWDAGLQVLGVSQKEVPVEFGNLRASAYIRSNDQSERPDPASLDPAENAQLPSDQLPEIGVELGYTANYAIYVHEDLEAAHTEGNAKYLENPIIRNERQIIEIIKERSGGE